MTDNTDHSKNHHDGKTHYYGDGCPENPAEPTRVVNVKVEQHDVMVDRSSPFGNPHPIGWCGICRRSHNRRESIEIYRYHFKQSIDRKFKLQLEELRGKRLGCHCKPQPCHGDVIVEWLERTGEYAPGSGSTFTIDCYRGNK